MIRHDRYRILLARRAELGNADEAQLAAHLASCDHCSELAIHYAAQDTELRLLAQVRPPAGIRDAVLARIDTTAVTDRTPITNRRRLTTSALALSLAAAAIFAFALVRNTTMPTTQSALERKGYVLISSTLSPSVHRAMAERIALAFFPGTVRSAALAHVTNARSQAFGRRGRLCWVVSITPVSGLLARPGNAWLDTNSPAAAGTGSFVIFIDAHLGNFVLASSATSA